MIEQFIRIREYFFGASAIVCIKRLYMRYGGVTPTEYQHGLSIQLINGTDIVIGYKRSVNVRSEECLHFQGLLETIMRERGKELFSARKTLRQEQVDEALLLCDDVRESHR